MKVPLKLLGFLEYQRLAWIALFSPRKAWDRMTQAIEEVRAQKLYEGLKDELEKHVR